uniref:Uncharacterized protein n=1 Tax=Xenopus tropicalis TaxID=8364 RepID=A0A803J9V1_XENTR
MGKRGICPGFLSDQELACIFDILSFILRIFNNDFLRASQWDFLLHRRMDETEGDFSLEHLKATLQTIARGDFVLPSEADDSCRKMADKYLLAIVLIYFKRSHLKYSHLNFFCAFYLAHDMEEDPDNAKLCLGSWKDLGELTRNFLKAHEGLSMCMNFRALVTRAECKELMSQSCPAHWAWLHERQASQHCHLSVLEASGGV